MKVSGLMFGCLLAALACAPAVPRLVADEEPTMQPVNVWSAEEARLNAETLTQKVRESESQAIRYLASIPAESKLDAQVGPPEAMAFLGTIRSLRAVSVLCDKLEWEKYHKEFVGHQLKYPASAALIQIGAPAAEALLSRVAATDVRKEYRWIVCGVLADIYGKDQVLKVISAFAIDAKRSESSEQRKRLDVLKDDFKLRYGIKSTKI